MRKDCGNSAERLRKHCGHNAEHGRSRCGRYVGVHSWATIHSRLSPHAQVQFRVPERRSLGTRLPLASFPGSSPLRNAILKLYMQREPGIFSHVTTRRNNFRIRLLVGCDGLEADASRFRWRKDRSQPNNSTCKLCHSVASSPGSLLKKERAWGRG